MRQFVIQVDAFTNQPFSGNPAAVCMLDAALEDRVMQQIAAELNLSETAFMLRQGQGFDLRWFTPIAEVPLCGHATLASAHVLWSERYLRAGMAARFHTKSGELLASKQGDWIELDFPVCRSRSPLSPPDLAAALGVEPKTVLENSLGYLVELESETGVRELQPNLDRLSALCVDGVIVTSRADAGSEFDFVSRFFAPNLGIAEDPVTGAAHCCLAPFWRDRLYKNTFLACQASRRGGVVKVSYDGGDRVSLSGQAVTVMRGELSWD